MSACRLLATSRQDQFVSLTQLRSFQIDPKVAFPKRAQPKVGPFFLHWYCWAESLKLRP